MTFQAADFLARLYCDRPAAPEPQAVALALADAPAAPGQPEGDTANGPLGELGYSAGDVGFDPATWVQRRDHAGRMGWERADLPDSAAWWRWSDFDDLPQPIAAGYCGDGEGGWLTP